MAVEVETIAGMEKAFTKRLEKRIVPAAGHFVHQEQPDIVNGFIMEFLEG